MAYLLLAAGGAIGTLFRYALSLFIDSRTSASFPWGTFTVNMTGSFLIGLAAGYAAAHSISNENRLLIFVGLLGGFTTFSSLALEGFNLMRNGQTFTAILYILTSNVFGIFLAMLGFYLFKR